MQDISYSHSEIRVESQIDRLKLTVLGSEEIFPRIIDQIINSIDIKGADLNFSEISQSTIDIVRSMQANKSTHEKANDEWLSLVTKGRATKGQLIKACENLTILKINFLKPVIEYIFMEGSHTKEHSSQLASKFFKAFKYENKGHWDLKTLENFSDKKFIIHRTANSKPTDPNEVYISAWSVGTDMGDTFVKFYLLNQIIYKEIFEYLRETLRLGYGITSMISVVGDQILLKFVLVGANAMAFEKPVEDFLRLVEKNLEGYGQAKLEQLKSKYRAKLITPYSELREEAETDTNDLYFMNRMGGYDRKGEHLDQLERVTSKDLQFEFREKIKNGRRMVFEYVRRVDDRVSVRKEQLLVPQEILVKKVA